MKAPHQSTGGTALKPTWGGIFLKLLVRLMRAAGWGAATLALIGFAGVISRAADLASHFRVLYFLVMALALATYLPGLKRRPLRGVLLFLLLVLDTLPVAALWLPNGRDVPLDSTRPSIRLLQFNTWFQNTEDASVIALIEAGQPDVASLQETRAPLRELARMRLAGRYDLLAGGSELLLIRRGSASVQLRGWALHRVADGGEAITADVIFEGLPVAILSLHATAPIGLEAAAARDEQLEGIARWCRASSAPVIVLGDLNATPWSHPFRHLLREGGLMDSGRGFGVQPTWRVRPGPVANWLSWPVQIPIDHCLHSPGLVTALRKTGAPCGSNHRPLLVTLQHSMAARP